MFCHSIECLSIYCFNIVCVSSDHIHKSNLISLVLPDSEMVKESKDEIAAQGLEGARSVVRRHHPGSLEGVHTPSPHPSNSPLFFYPLLLFCSLTGLTFPPQGGFLIISSILPALQRRKDLTHESANCIKGKLLLLEQKYTLHIFICWVQQVVSSGAKNAVLQTLKKRDKRGLFQSLHSLKSNICLSEEGTKAKRINFPTYRFHFIFGVKKTRRLVGL